MDAENEKILLQVRLFRLAMESWKKSQQEVASLFRKNDVYRYISDMYEGFHIQGDNANLKEIEAYLKGKGAIDSDLIRKINFAMNLLAQMTISTIAKRTGTDPLDVIANFMESDTAKILYDKETGLWENGPDYIANEYEQERALKAS